MANHFQAGQSLFLISQQELQLDLELQPQHFFLQHFFLQHLRLQQLDACEIVGTITAAPVIDNSATKASLFFIRSPFFGFKKNTYHSHILQKIFCKNQHIVIISQSIAFFYCLTVFYT